MIVMKSFLNKSGTYVWTKPYELVANNEWADALYDNRTLTIEFEDTKTHAIVSHTINSDRQFLDLMEKYNPYGYVDVSSKGETFSPAVLVNKQSLDFLALVNHVNLVEVTLGRHPELDNLRENCKVSSIAVDDMCTLFDMAYRGESWWCTLFNMCHFARDGFYGDSFFMPHYDTSGPRLKSTKYKMYKVDFLNPREAQRFLTRAATLYKNPIAEALN